MRLNPENFNKGFLIDDELMAGVSENPERPGIFVAFVLQLSTGEYLGARDFPLLQEALDAINGIPREWVYEKSGGCGGCADGQCGKGSCGAGKCGPAGAC